MALFALLFVSAAGTAAFARVDISAPGATSTPPPPGPLATTLFPAPVETTLPNGLRIITIRSGNVPLITAQLLSRRGSASDPAGKHGTAAAAARVMLEGTATRDARAIAVVTDALGAELTATPGADSTSVTVNATSDKFAQALDVMADVVRHPTFPASEVKRSRKQLVANLRQSYGNTEALVGLAITRALFGSAGYGNSLEGTPASAAAIGRDDLIAFHAAAFRPDLCVLVIAGDIDARRAFALAARAYGTWAAPAAPPAPTAPAKVATAPRFIVIDKPDAGAGVIAAGFRAIPRSSADYPTGTMANAVLSGYSGRLNEEIRVKRGLAYGAYSTIGALATDGTLIARTLSVENPKIPQATDVVLATLRDFGTTAVPQRELDARRMATLGQRSYTLQRQRGIADSLATYARYGLPLTAINTEVAADRAVTSDSVRTFAQRYLTGPTVVIIGKAADFLPGLRLKYPRLEVIPFDRLDLDSPTLRAGM